MNTFNESHIRKTLSTKLVGFVELVDLIVGCACMCY